MIQNKQQSVRPGKHTNPLLKYIWYIIIYISYIYIFIYIQLLSGDLKFTVHFCCFPWWFIFLEGTPYLHLPSQSFRPSPNPEVRYWWVPGCSAEGQGLQIDDEDVTAVLGDILFHGSGRWWWTLSLLPQNLGNMEALSPIIWAKWPL